MMARIENIDGNPVGMHLTPRGNLVVESSLENSIHEGRRFYAMDFKEVLTDSVTTFLMIPAEGYQIHIDTELVSDVGCDVEVYVNPTITNYGSEITLFNRNQNYITRTINAKAYTDITTSDNGTLILRDKITATKKSSASRHDTGEFILVYPFKSLIRVIASANGYLTWNFGVSEVVSY